MVRFHFWSKSRYSHLYDSWCIYTLAHKMSRTILTWFPALQRGRVRSPGHVSTHCTHACFWNQPWAAAVGYGGSICCTLEVINGPSAWRSGLSTSSWDDKIIQALFFHSHAIRQVFRTLSCSCSFHFVHICAISYTLFLCTMVLWILGC